MKIRHFAAVAAIILLGTIFLSSKKPGGTLSADGPYILYRNDSTRVIRVNPDGTIFDSTYYRTPAAFNVCDHQGNYPFTVSLRPIRRQKWDYRSIPERVFVMSDPHGRMDCAVSLLCGNGVMDDKLDWSFGTGHLVLIGDLFDRGDDAVQLFWLFYKLQQEAYDAGGRVTILLGNHEPMEFSGDMRYATPKYQLLADELGLEYRDLFGPDSELGRWIASWNVIGIVGRDLFVHAGLGGDFYKQDIPVEEVNLEMSKALFLRNRERKAASDKLAFLYGSYGPVWNRGLLLDGKKWHPVTADTLQLILNRYDVDHIIVGHTIIDDVSSFYDGRVIGVNVDNEKNRRKGLGRALFIEHGHYYVAGDKGILRELK